MGHIDYQPGDSYRIPINTSDENTLYSRRAAEKHVLNFFRAGVHHAICKGRMLGFHAI